MKPRSLAEAMKELEKLETSNSFMRKVIERLTGRSVLWLSIDDEHVYDNHGISNGGTAVRLT